MALPHPIEVIKFRIDQRGLKQKNLLGYFADIQTSKP